MAGFGAAPEEGGADCGDGEPLSDDQQAFASRTISTCRVRRAYWLCDQMSSTAWRGCRVASRTSGPRSLDQDPVVVGEHQVADVPLGEGPDIGDIVGLESALKTVRGRRLHQCERDVLQRPGQIGKATLGVRVGEVVPDRVRGQRQLRRRVLEEVQSVARSLPGGDKAVSPSSMSGRVDRSAVHVDDTFVERPRRFEVTRHERDVVDLAPSYRCHTHMVA